jgi:GTPase SAR1 family protein
VVINLWDIAGQTRFAGDCPEGYCQNADGFICMYDVGRTSSFTTMVNRMKTIKSTYPNALQVMVANKTDIAAASNEDLLSLIMGKKVELIEPKENQKTKSELGPREVIHRLHYKPIDMMKAN